ncbi:hypothetical protein [Kutzneria kofuensis]|uniref:Uncharacterized protein n=1 Tax=Kutzneria kofuensis TaxID=103725 RepID=A0A7W9KQ25_9PSEU|nr:hypothetical protein [Kutzneria kofuensis]MBB5896343.1 hypothetical protein [Kutzneria kofuensis]
MADPLGLADVEPAAGETLPGLMDRLTETRRTPHVRGSSEDEALDDEFVARLAEVARGDVIYLTPAVEPKPAVFDRSRGGARTASRVVGSAVEQAGLGIARCVLRRVGQE